MTKAIQQPLQASCGLSRIWVPLIELDLDQSPTIENQVARNSENILNESCGSEGSEWPVREHPVGYPSQRIMRHIRQEHKGFLSEQAFLASFTELQSTLVRLDFGFASTTIVVTSDDLRHRPIQHRADHRTMLCLAFWRAPTQHQVLNRAHVGWWIDCAGDPPIVWTKRKPVFGCDTPRKGTRPLSAASFGQHLPLLAQGIVHIVVTPKTGIGSEDGTLFLRLVELHELCQRLQHRDIRRATMLLARIEV